MKPALRAGPVRVRVPATSANLGPGFDALGLALGLYDDVVVRVAEDGLSVDVAGEGETTLPRDHRHLVVTALTATFTQLGCAPRGLELVCANRIPQSRGLGSSAAAIVAGVLAARALVLGGAELLDDAAVLALAVSLEGHPDNVAACLLGGLTVAWMDAAGPRAVRLEPAQDVAAMAFVPATESSTARVRQLLPAQVPHVDAAATAGRAALLPTALTARPELLFAATEDRLHQQYRAPAMRASAALVDRLRADGVPAVISGAGPTVLVLGISDDIDTLSSYGGPGWTTFVLSVDRDGARLLPLAG